MLGIEQEFHRAGIAVARRAGDAEAAAHSSLRIVGRKIRGRSDFHDFLVAPLHRTIAFPQVQHIAVMVGEDLHFQMARAGKIFFEEDGSIAEGCQRLASRFLEAVVELRFVMHHAHAAAAAAHGGFDHQRETDFAGGGASLRGGERGDFRSGQNGHPGGGCEPARRRLIAEQFQQFGSGTDENDAGVAASAGQRRIFGEKAVSGMNRVHVLFSRELDDARDVQIRFDGTFSGADLVGLVRLEAMQAEAVFLRIDGDGAEVEFSWPRGKCGWRFRCDWRRGVF